jgi:hypothetical protein
MTYCNIDIEANLNALSPSPPPPESSEPSLPQQLKRRYQRRRSLSPASQLLYDEERKSRRREQQAAYMRRKRARINSLADVEKEDARAKERGYQQHYRTRCVILVSHAYP